MAEAAGVSVSTVSRVLSKKGDVAPETYEKVQKVEIVRDWLDPTRIYHQSV